MENGGDGWKTGGTVLYVERNVAGIGGMDEAKPRPNTYAMMLHLAEERKRALADRLERELAAGRTGGREVLLEVGCGHGHWLAAYAEQAPDVYCVGIDLRTKRIERANRKREKRGLENTVFIKAEAREFLEVMPGTVLFSTVCFLFLDPWPKARHHKKRLIQPGFLDLLASRVVPGGRLYFRTDHDGHFEWTREMIEAHGCWAHDPGNPWLFENRTYFQDFMASWKSLVARRTSDQVKEEDKGDLGEKSESG